MILRSKQHGKHPFSSQNTQHVAGGRGGIQVKPRDAMGSLKIQTNFETRNCC